jgi:hypothetical protein
VSSGVVDPAYYYNYGVTSPLVPTTNQPLTRNYRTEVIETVPPLPTVSIDPTSLQTVDGSTSGAGSLASVGNPTK